MSGTARGDDDLTFVLAQACAFGVDRVGGISTNVSVLRKDTREDLEVFTVRPQEFFGMVAQSDDARAHAAPVER